jgi:prophage antirepressor-like protein
MASNTVSSAAARAFNFPGDGKPVRTVVLESGEPGFVGKDVCDRLGYANHNDAIGKHCRGVAIRYPILDALGRSQDARILTEPDVLRLIIASKLPAAQEFERWVFEDVLPAIRKTGAYAHPEAQPGLSRDAVVLLELALTSARMSADILRLEGSARLGITREAHKLAGAAHLLPMLPVYAVDAPTGTESTIGSQPTASLTELLTRHNTGKSALAVNKLLAGAGLIEQMTRPTARGAEAKFWSVTSLGTRWGKNVTSPSSPKETQPHWYISTFTGLLSHLGIPPMHVAAQTADIH